MLQALHNIFEASANDVVCCQCLVSSANDVVFCQCLVSSANDVVFCLCFVCCAWLSPHPT